MWLNILGAIKYSEIPEIDIYTENIKDMILIKVKDNGLGMSKVAQEFWEVLQRTHRRFTQREGAWLRSGLCQKDSRRP
jgi:two-component system phosphate regulon sensor histidine kinase PhoR